MNTYLVLTNNKIVADKYAKHCNITKVDGAYLDVLIEARNRIHAGYRLMTHPLVGSVKPNETPYRSIILEKGDRLDFQSLQIIEDSLSTYRKFAENQETPQWAERVLADFAFVDEKLFASAFESLIMK